MPDTKYQLISNSLWTIPTPSRAKRSQRRSWVDTAVRPDYKPALPAPRRDMPR